MFGKAFFNSIGIDTLKRLCHFVAAKVDANCWYSTIRSVFIIFTNNSTKNGNDKNTCAVIIPIPKVSLIRSGN